MSRFKDIENIWQEQGGKRNIPEASAIIKKTEKMKRKLVIRHSIGIGVLMLTLVYISTFLFQYDFALPTTYVGIIIVLISIVLGIIFQSQLIGIILPSTDLTKDTSRHLEQSLIYQSRLKYLHKKGISIYYLLLSGGFALYINEFAHRDMWFGIVAFLLTMSWMLFSWFYLRKRSVKKNEQRVNEHIEELRMIQERFRE